MHAWQWQVNIWKCGKAGVASACELTLVAISRALSSQLILITLHYHTRTVSQLLPLSSLIPWTLVYELQQALGYSPIRPRSCISIAPHTAFPKGHDRDSFPKSIEKIYIFRFLYFSLVSCVYVLYVYVWLFYIFWSLRPLFAFVQSCPLCLLAMLPFCCQGRGM